MRSYPYLVISLGSISIKEEPRVDLSSFLDICKMGLHQKDFALLNDLRLKFDNQNIIHHLQGDNLYHAAALFKKDQLNDLLQGKLALPSYLGQFLQEKNVLKLSYLYLQYLQKKNKFAYEYNLFCYHLELLLVALNCRKYDLKIAPEILPLDPFSRNLVENNSRDFSLSALYPWVNNIINDFNKDLFVREELLLRYKIDFIEQSLRFEYFTFNRIIAYFYLLTELMQFKKFNEEQGHLKCQEIIEQLVNQARRDHL